MAASLVAVPTPVVIVVVIIIVAPPRTVRRGRRRRLRVPICRCGGRLLRRRSDRLLLECGLSLDDLVQLAAVEPHAAALRAVVDLDPLPLTHHQRYAAMWAVHLVLRFTQIPNAPRPPTRPNPDRRGTPHPRMAGALRVTTVPSDSLRKTDGPDPLDGGSRRRRPHFSVARRMAGC